MKLVIAVFCTVAFCSVAIYSAQAKTIKLGTLAPEGSPWYEIIQDMGEKWKKVSGGTINLRIYPGGIAGDEGDVVKKMRVGQLHAALISVPGLADIVPEIRTLQMPMMYRSYAELDYVRDRIAPVLEGLLRKKKFEPLAWGDAGWLYFFTQRPVVHPDDLKPLKLFTWTGNTTFTEIWKDLGYHPVPLAATEIHMGLLSGLINAVPAPPLAALSFQWFGLANHMTDLKFAPLVGALVISTRAWQTIPEDIRPLLLEAAREAGERLKETRKVEVEAIKVMQTYGLVIHHVPPEVVQLWEQRARLAYPRVTKETNSTELVAEVERIRNEYRNLRGGQ